jgi:hypothetical protein
LLESRFAAGQGYSSILASSRCLVVYQSLYRSWLCIPMGYYASWIWASVRGYSGAAKLSRNIGVLITDGQRAAGMDG